MIEKEEIARIMAQDTRFQEFEDFRLWLLGVKVQGVKQAYNNAMNLKALFRKNAVYTINQTEVNRLLAKVRTSGYSSSHQRHLLQALELFIEFKGIQGIQPIKKPRQTRKMPSYLPIEEMKKLIDGCRTYRQLAIVTLFMKTGLRLAELCNLNIGDIDTDNRVIRVRSGKGDRDREVDMDDQLVQILNTYRVKYNIINVKPDHPLFLSERKQRISRHAVEEEIKKVGQQAGFAVKIKPHVLRHSFATHCTQNGTDIISLRDLLGHADISTTEIYLHCNNPARKQAYNRGVPRF
ncbi:MAG: tyrosine-type recombinase/integrase [Methanomassiliicoccus sp.]|nr:tyrosine-type recombinase/integrase [Methanomassiliicoccus sp.]